jgi:uncharacterized paraquat-inducible protein A
MGSILRFAFEVGAEMFHEWRRSRAKAKAQRDWANTPTTVRGCPRCHEIAYRPGQVSCERCGALLGR